MYRVLKRLFDLTFGIIMLALVLPLICVLLALKYIEDLGSPVYVSTRVGLNKELFRLYKVRSMSIGRHEVSHPTASIKSPVTRLGRILRNTKLDELLQLVNIIDGTMSFVGRRPDIPANVESDIYDESTDFIFSMQPGLTDLACLYFSDLSRQASRHENPHDFYIREVWPIKKRLIRFHFDNQSLLLDFVVLLFTPIGIINPDLGRLLARRVVCNWPNRERLKVYE